MLEITLKRDAVQKSQNRLWLTIVTIDTDDMGEASSLLFLGTGNDRRLSGY